MIIKLYLASLLALPSILIPVLCELLPGKKKGEVGYLGMIQLFLPVWLSAGGRGTVRCLLRATELSAQTQAYLGWGRQSKSSALWESGIY